MALQDTADAAAAVLLEGWRAMPASQRMALVDAWSRDVRILAAAGVRARHPELGDVETRLAVARLLYGEQVITPDVERAARAVR